MAEHLRAAKSESRPLWERREDLFEDLPAAQVIALAGFFASISETGRCVFVTDLDPHRLIYLGDSYSVGGIDESMAGRWGS